MYYTIQMHNKEALVNALHCNVLLLDTEALTGKDVLGFIQRVNKLLCSPFGSYVSKTCFEIKDDNGKYVDDFFFLQKMQRSIGYFIYGFDYMENCNIPPYAPEQFQKLHTEIVQKRQRYLEARSMIGHLRTLAKLRFEMRLGAVE